MEGSGQTKPRVVSNGEFSATMQRAHWGNHCPTLKRGYIGESTVYCRFDFPSLIGQFKGTKVTLTDRIRGRASQESSGGAFMFLVPAKLAPPE